MFRISLLDSPACTVNASRNWSLQEEAPIIMEALLLCIIRSTELCTRKKKQQERKRKDQNGILNRSQMGRERREARQIDAKTNLFCDLHVAQRFPKLYCTTSPTIHLEGLPTCTALLTLNSLLSLILICILVTSPSLGLPSRAIFSTSVSVSGSFASISS